MELKYSQAIKAGIIGGVGLSIVLIAVAALNIIGSWTTDIIGLCGCCAWIFYLVIMLGTGALAVRFTAPMLKEMNDTIVVSAFAGGVAGLVAGVVNAIITFITPFISGSTYTNDVSSSLADAGLSSIGLGGLALCCCLPMWIVVGVILAAIGGVIYQAISPKA